MNFISTTKGSRLLQRVLAIVLVIATAFTLVPENVLAAGKVSIDTIHISEDVYVEKMADVVEPYLEELIQTGYVTGKKDVSLYYEKYIVKQAKGTVVISHGFTENLEKYNEMIYYFTNMGYSVYALEHRGHSRSGRLGKDDTQVNVEDFDYYVEDLKTFLDKVVVPEASKDNLYLFGHSMGGGIAVRFLETYTKYFDAAILSSPMIEVNTGTVPDFLAKALAYGISYTKYADEYVLGHGPYTDDYDLAGSGTSSEVRYNYNYNTRINNEELRMGGASYRWCSEAFAATYTMRLWCQASKVKIPVILFQAGQDTYVGNDGQNTFAKYAKNCELVRYENAKHEIYAECDEIQTDYLNKVFGFLANN